MAVISIPHLAANSVPNILHGVEDARDDEEAAESNRRLRTIGAGTGYCSSVLPAVNIAIAYFARQ